MTQDDIIRMAEEAGIESAFHLEKNQYVYRFGHGSVERFAAFVAAAEREACAKVCEQQIKRWIDDRARYAANECAAAIQAKGKE